jgi:Fe-S cluster biosynthesis and repair protein YggX
MAGARSVCYGQSFPYAKESHTMSRTVSCVKLHKDLPGLPYPPFKGELGERIYSSISQEAWKGWLGHSTMVINENRLNPSDPEAQKILMRELEKFLFGPGAEKPQGYTPPPAG